MLSHLLVSNVDHTPTALRPMQPDQQTRMRRPTRLWENFSHVLNCRINLCNDHQFQAVSGLDFRSILRIKNLSAISKPTLLGSCLRKATVNSLESFYLETMSMSMIECLLFKGVVDLPTGCYIRNVCHHEIK